MTQEQKTILDKAISLIGNASELINQELLDYVEDEQEAEDLYNFHSLLMGIQLAHASGQIPTLDLCD